MPQSLTVRSSSTEEVRLAESGVHAREPAIVKPQMYSLAEESRRTMRIEYGPKYDIASVTFVEVIEDGALVSDVCVHRPGADIYLGFTASGRLLQIEILGASRVLTPETLRAAFTMDEATVVRRSDETDSPKEALRVGVPHRASWWSRYRERRRRPRVPFYGVCPTCGHDWREHPGGIFEPDTATCGECDYEVDHNQRETSEPPCRLPAPAPPRAHT